MDQKFWDKIDSFRQNREYDKIISEIKEEIPEFWDKMDISEEDGEYDKVIREIKNLYNEGSCRLTSTQSS